MRRVTKIILTLGIAVAVAVAALVLFAFSSGREDKGKHLTRVDWLPAEASDVTFVKSEGFGWFTCYECGLPKEAFERLAQKKKWRPEPKTDVSTGLRHVLGLPALKKTEYGDTDSVANALFYENRQPNGGGITVIYDLDGNRLFVHESHR